jgi:hypothetical protein
MGRGAGGQRGVWGGGSVGSGEGNPPPWCGADTHKMPLRQPFRAEGPRGTGGGGGGWTVSGRCAAHNTFRNPPTTVQPTGPLPRRPQVPPRRHPTPGTGQARFPAATMAWRPGYAPHVSLPGTTRHSRGVGRGVARPGIQQGPVEGSPSPAEPQPARHVSSGRPGTPPRTQKKRKVMAGGVEEAAPSARSRPAKPAGAWRAAAEWALTKHIGAPATSPPNTRIARNRLAGVCTAVRAGAHGAAEAYSCAGLSCFSPFLSCPFVTTKSGVCRSIDAPRGAWVRSPVRAGADRRETVEVGRREESKKKEERA